MALGATAAFLAAGRDWGPAAALSWAAFTLYFSGSVLYVKMRVHDARSADDRHRWRHGAVCGLFHLGLGVLALGLATGAGPGLHFAVLGGVAAAPPYGAAKAGVSALTVHLAKVMAPFGVRVNALAPGIIDTDMVRGMASAGHDDLAKQIPLGEQGRAEDVANAALFLLSDMASGITGAIIPVDAGYGIVAL